MKLSFCELKQKQKCIIDTIDSHSKTLTLFYFILYFPSPTAVKLNILCDALLWIQSGIYLYDFLSLDPGDEQQTTSRFNANSSCSALATEMNICNVTLIWKLIQEEYFGSN